MYGRFWGVHRGQAGLNSDHVLGIECAETLGELGSVECGYLVTNSNAFIAEATGSFG